MALLAWTAGCADTVAYIADAPAETPPIAALERRLLLIGDAGDDDDTSVGRQPALSALAETIASRPEPATVVFLGDLIYEHGYPAAGTEAERGKARNRLANEVSAATGADTILVPGNHDWANGRPEGWANVRALGSLVTDDLSKSQPRIDVLPAGGCPGPVVVPLGSHTDLIAIDTQWWLHAFAKPGPDDNPTGCAETTEAEVLASLRSALAAAHAARRHAIIVAHHPLRSYGSHGGFFDWRAHLFPLTMTLRWAWFPFPGIGSAVVYWRAYHSWMAQDLSHPSYRHLSTALETVLRQAAEEGEGPIANAAGHDHNLQVMRDPWTGIHHLVSGQGSPDQVMHVTHGDDTVFSHARADRPGFMEIDLYHDGSARLAVIEAPADTAAPEVVFRRTIARPW